VERFSDPAPENWQAYMMYESMWLCPLTRGCDLDQDPTLAANI
jgi:hypothetical protein